MADKEQVGALTVLIFDRIQQHPRKEYQLLALASAFLLMCKAARISAAEVFTYVTNLMYDPLHSRGMGSRFAAMLRHLETELLSKRTGRYA